MEISKTLWLKFWGKRKIPSPLILFRQQPDGSLAAQLLHSHRRRRPLRPRLHQSHTDAKLEFRHRWWSEGEPQPDHRLRRQNPRPPPQALPDGIFLQRRFATPAPPETVTHLPLPFLLWISFRSTLPPPLILGFFFFLSETLWWRSSMGYRNWRKIATSRSLWRSSSGFFGSWLFRPHLVCLICLFHLRLNNFRRFCFFPCSLIDDGKNPDQFTRDVINSFISKNQITKGKTDALKVNSSIPFFSRIYLT